MGLCYSFRQQIIVLYYRRHNKKEIDKFFVVVRHTALGVRVNKLGEEPA